MNDKSAGASPKARASSKLQESKPSQAAGDPPSGTGIHSHLERARRIAPELAAATNDVNSALSRVEQALVALNLGVTAGVDLVPSYGDDWQQVLSFGKLGSAWKLILQSGPPGADYEDWSESPLLSASKEVRVRAVERLEPLLQKLIEVAENQVEELKEAASRARNLASAIEGLK